MFLGWRLQEFEMGWSGPYLMVGLGRIELGQTRRL